MFFVWLEEKGEQVGSRIFVVAPAAHSKECRLLGRDILLYLLKKRFQTVVHLKPSLRRLGAHVDIGAFEIIPNSPPLTITRSSNEVVLSWSTNAAGFTLETTPTALNSSHTWTNAGTPVIVGSHFTVTNTATS